MPSGRLGIHTALPLLRRSALYSKSGSQGNPLNYDYGHRYWHTRTSAPQTLKFRIRYSKRRSVKHQAADASSRLKIRGGDPYPLQFELPVLTVHCASSKESTPHGDTEYKFIEETQTTSTPFLTKVLYLAEEAGNHKADNSRLESFILNNPRMLIVELPTVQLCSRIRGRRCQQNIETESCISAAGPCL